MSDYYEEDSFESESDQEDGEREENRESKEVVLQLAPPSDSQVVQDPSSSSGVPSVSSSFVSSHPSRIMGLAGHSNSDIDELELPVSRRPSTKSEHSPKPRKKFRVKKPNIGSFFRNKKKDTIIFGTPLEVAVQRSQLSSDSIELPTPFRQCLDFLEENGLDHQGIYRLPGVKSKVEELKSHFDKREVVDLSGQDANTVASLMKLYLRELPDPLIPRQKLIGKTENLLDMSSEKQYEVVKEVMDDLPPTNRLLLNWFLEHMKHIIAKSAVNKMTLPNMVIVFSPTLQIPAHFLHTLYNHSQALNGNVELKKYRRPSVSRKSSGITELLVTEKYQRPSVSRKSSLLVTEKDVSSEIDRLTGLLMKLHSKVAGKFDSREEDIWKLQRNITELRRKKKVIQTKFTPDIATKEIQDANTSDFMKTLLLMEATLLVENKELLDKKEKLQAAIKKEAEMIDQYKCELRKYSGASRRVMSSDESGDEADLAKKIAALKWHEKEMEMRNRNLVQSIIEEDEVILNLKVKLKVLPLSKELLQVDEQD